MRARLFVKRSAYNARNNDDSDIEAELLLSLRQSPRAPNVIPGLLIACPRAVFQFFELGHDGSFRRAPHDTEYRKGRILTRELPKYSSLGADAAT